MTEKRFTMCYGQNDINGWTMSIVDWETKEPFNYTTYEVHSSSIIDTKDEMEDLCLLLNELNDENKKLRIFLKAVNEELSLANRDNDTLEEENKALHKELHLIHMSSMFSTVKSFKGDISKRYKYSEKTNMIYDTANHYGGHNKVLDKKEITMLLNEYNTLLEGSNEECF